MVSVGHDPAAGTPLNSLTTASFNGSNMLAAWQLLNTDYFSGTDGSCWVLFKANTAAAPAANYTEGVFLTDATNAETTVGFTTNGAEVTVVSGGIYVQSQTACSTGAWHLLQARWNTSTIDIRVDNGAWVTNAFGGFGSIIASALITGRSYGLNYFDGLLAEIAMSSVRLSDADFNNVRSYINGRYNLSL